MDRQPVLSGGFGGVHHQLLPQRAAVGVGRRQPLGAREQLAVAFAHAAPVRRSAAGWAARPPSSVQPPETCAAVPTPMIISGTLTLRLKKRARWRSPWAVPSTPRNTDGTGESVPMQQIADRVVGGLAVDAFLTAHIHRQLDGVAVVAVEIAQRVSADVAGDAVGPVPGSPARWPVIADTSSTSARIFGSMSTAATATGGSSDRLSDSSVRSYVVRPETGDAAQHHAGRDVRWRRTDPASRRPGTGDVAGARCRSPK